MANLTKEAMALWDDPERDKIIKNNPPNTIWWKISYVISIYLLPTISLAYNILLK